jgi:integrase
MDVIGLTPPGTPGGKKSQGHQEGVPVDAALFDAGALSAATARFGAGVAERDRVNVNTLFEFFLAHLDQRVEIDDLSARTAQIYKCSVPVVLDDLGDLPVEGIERWQIVRWHQALLRHQNPRTGKPALARAGAALGVLARAIEFGLNTGLLRGVAANPARAVPLPRIGVRERYLDEDEILGFVRACDEVERRGATSRSYCESSRIGKAGVVAAIRLLLLTGIRPVEARKLRWTHLRHPGRLELRVSKSGPRIVPICAGASELLAQQEAIIGGRSPWVFPSPTTWGAPFGSTSYTRYWDRIRAIAGFDDEVVLYVLRHTWACQALLAGEDLQDISLVLGHKNVEVTRKHYIHVVCTPRASATAARVGDRLVALTRRSAA